MKTRNDNTHGKKPQRTRVLTPADALQVLESAISYVRASGLVVKVINAPSGTVLLVAIYAAHIESGTSRLVPDASPAEWGESEGGDVPDKPQVPDAHVPDTTPPAKRGELEGGEGNVPDEAAS